VQIIRIDKTLQSCDYRIISDRIISTRINNFSL